MRASGTPKVHSAHIDKSALTNSAVECMKVHILPEMLALVITEASLHMQASWTPKVHSAHIDKSALTTRVHGEVRILPELAALVSLSPHYICRRPGRPKCTVLT